MPLEPVAAPAAAAGDISQGYCIEISVLPDGQYKVSGPVSLEAKAADDEGDAYGSEVGEDFPTVGAALKHVLELIKQNPTGGDATQQLEAGYAAR
jgi:hypothetical protein